MKSKILMLLCLICTVFATTSCLNDNNDRPSYVPLTPDQKHALCIETNGTYQGYYYFLKEGEKNKADSAQITFTVNDSTLIMNNYPVKSLGAYIQDANAKSIIANAPAASLKFAFNGYEITNGATASAGNHYSIWMIPGDSNLKFTTSYTAEDKTHTIVIQFASVMQYYNSLYYAMAGYQNRKLQANVIVKEVAIDGNAYSIQTAFGLHANKIHY